MKSFVRGCAVGLLMLVAACASKPGSDLVDPIDANAAIKPAQGQAVLVVGYLVNDKVPRSWSNPAPSTLLSWVKIDPSTRMRVGKEMPFFYRRGGCCFDPGLRYAAYVVAPGTYALGWVEYKDTYQPTQFESIQRTSGAYSDSGFQFSQRARAQPFAPTFQIGDGEVVYVGDLILDFRTTDRLAWRFERNDEAAKARLNNPDLAARMVYRSTIRADGVPVQPGDGMTFRWY